ncbi:hypothetical protein BCR33DRAFT_723915 [Rhizoclosmatium globosum]|uniref:DAGKc domain-containing protein n=1 Tax=Rhizoclosmatium globosum TaxID=329046 RepID=A0A1Y2B9W7_9FUNG|nr:hypothetical protein BCR33DRAFT_723915 [Rhizoclosmatium globosum]|eukprot:ORY31564.1 hypothetical protein BCR33DRAFT_723915 [Rhizoclosmatium globosum]
MSAKPRLTAILNPQSGKGASLQVWNQIAASASSTFETTLAQTERPRHATQLAIDAISNGSTLILVVGGDGTLSEVVNGYIAANGKDKGVTLAIIHTGTGGDFAKSAGIPRNPLDAWNLVLKETRNGKFLERLKVLRDSVISDGLFNTMTLRDPSTSEFVMYADSGLKHGDFHEKCPEKSEVGMAVNVVAEPVEVGGDGIGEEVWVEADGEVVGVLPAEFTVLPGAVRLIVP